MKAIKTTYVGPGEHKPARIIATDGDNRLIVSRWAEGIDHDDITEVHRNAARQFISTMGWSWKAFVTGGIKDSCYHVFVE